MSVKKKKKPFSEITFKYILSHDLSLIFQAVFGRNGFVNYDKFYSIAMYKILRRTNPSFEIWGENEKAETTS